MCTIWLHKWVEVGGEKYPPTPSWQGWRQPVVVYHNHLVVCWDVGPPSSSSAAGCLPLLPHPRGVQAVVWTEQNVSITLSARKPPHQQLLLLVSGEWFLMRCPQPFFTPLSVATWRGLWWAYFVSCRSGSIERWHKVVPFQGGSVAMLIVTSLEEFRIPYWGCDGAERMRSHP